ncbi:stage 0 sporulation protein J [Burkholderia lata]|uniref:plasmid partitioning protein RepB C-terminal domain-containing protein n=1 Tax=Burkholderia lata (strain ATCC 17760 / DSM 23089 / LMG 22485 / NCIMB 9086 / R18194 / 383) TaxID=482957 RepID=UPI00145413CD|nr:plasmid partitioning protein RepB C-terminal domain-containing protein [Burkholderia lata]VWC14341.1 stage 0 sporulation protein J [Burkholderia lata]
MNEDDIAGPIELVPVNQIRVLNPRARNRRLHSEIVRNIAAVGLKRPITVCRTEETTKSGVFDLVCGQGRLEAFIELGQSEIPAHVIDASEHECLIKSLVENIARPQKSTVELLDSISILKHRGYSNAEVGRKIGVSAEWVKDVVMLLEKGERRLLAAVEAGHMSLTLAIEIARSPDSECQNLLMEAYNRGDLRGKKVSVVRKVLAMRSRMGKAGTLNIVGKGRGKTYKPEELRRIYEVEAAKHRALHKRAEFTQSRLLGAIEAFRDLLQIEEFVTLLSEEKRDSMPEFLKEAATRREAGAP